MSNWLLKEEPSFEPSLMVQSASRTVRSKETYSILLRNVTVLNNRRLLLSSDVIVYTVIVDGYPDMKSDQPSWGEEFHISKILGRTLEDYQKDPEVIKTSAEMQQQIVLLLLHYPEKSNPEFVELSEVSKKRPGTQWSTMIPRGNSEIKLLPWQRRWVCGRAQMNAPRRSVCVVSLCHHTSPWPHMPLRPPPTPVLFQPTDAVECFTPCYHATSIATRSAPPSSV